MQCTLQLYFKTAPARSNAVVKGLNSPKSFTNLLSGSMSLILNKMGLMHQYGSLRVPQTPKSHDTLIKVFKFIRNKLYFCTHIESEMLKIYFVVCEPFRQSQPSVDRGQRTCSSHTICCTSQLATLKSHAFSLLLGLCFMG